MNYDNNNYLFTTIQKRRMKAQQHHDKKHPKL